jgi:5-methylcytosine-specific restriction endonuclease McrA
VTTIERPAAVMDSEGEPAPAAALPGGRQGQRAMVSSRVLVLNASYEPINVCTVRRAAVLVLKDRAEILEHADQLMHAESLSLLRPAVIRLRTYVRIPRDAHSRRITRRAVFARDLWTCQYCGTVRSTLTVDHVIPRSKGGHSSRDNIVASCAPCNRRKGDRLPTQIDMHPRRKPAPPHPTIFVRVATPRIPSAWEQYLAAGALRNTAFNWTRSTERLLRRPTAPGRRDESQPSLSTMPGVDSAKRVQRST